MTTILTPTESIDVDGNSEGDALWLSEGDLTRATGYELKPEGFCRDTVCVPVPPGRDAEFVRDDGRSLNLAAFWRLLGGPVVADEAGATWSLGEPAPAGMPGLQALPGTGAPLAPDFTLPDAAGTLHSLSDYRGQKVLLAAWASW